jgi:peptide/nickel transport system substrate-binding protein
MKFKNGEIDLYGVRGIDYPWLKRLSEDKKRFSIYDLGPTLSKTFITFNQNPGIREKTDKPYCDPVKIAWFHNRSFRRAVAHAINKKNIIDLLYNGLAITQDSSMSPSSGFFYTDDVKTYDYSLETSRHLLRSEGFVDRDNDGICEDPEGHPIIFNFHISAGNPQATELANLIRKDLSQIGLKVNLLQIEFNALVNKLTNSYDWDMVMIGLTGGIEPHFGANVWLSNSPLHMWFPRQSVPRTDWEARIDEIFTTGVSELDPQKRKVLYDEWQRIVSEELPVIYTVIPLQYTAVNNRVKNIKPTALGGVLHNIEELYIDK